MRDRVRVCVNTVQRLKVVVDSPTMARELSGKRRVLTPELAPLHERVMGLSKSFPDFKVEAAGGAGEDEEEEEGGGRATTAAATSSAKHSEQAQGLLTGKADKRFLMRFDGGSRGNPGPAGAGVVIFSESGNTEGGNGAIMEVYTGALWLGPDLTNNEAEYKGLIEGLTAAKNLGIKVRSHEQEGRLVGWLPLKLTCFGAHCSG